MDIFKLLKTLNSAQSSWQITLAIMLAMISGFLPLFTPLNFLLLFIAFAINIPLAVFFFMSVVFTTLGYVLDPIFASLGYEVLTMPELNETFTAMYNYAPTLWTSYNYTILMGSLLISLPVSIILFPFLNKLIDKYRDVLEAKFKDSKYFSWLNPYSEKNLKKKPGILRLWAAGLFIAVIAIIATIMLYIIDPIIKYALEYSLSKTTQRTVQIDDVTSKFFEAKLKITNISFIDKGNADANDITIDKVTIKFNIEHLLEKKVDFEIISFGNITLKASVKKKENRPEDQLLTKTTNMTKSMTDGIKAPELPKVEDLIAKEGLQSVAAAQEIQKNIQTISDKWSKFAQDDAQKEKIKSIEKKIKSLEKKANNIKTPEQILAIVQEADALKKELEAVNSELARMTQEYKKDKKTIQRHIKEIQTLPMQDYKRLANKYSLDQNGAMNLIGTYFSSSLAKYLRMGTKYYEMAKPYISSEKEESEPEKERMRGKWIKYANTSPYPDFVIRKLNANVIMDAINYDLKIKDISDSQKIYNKPLTGLMTSKSRDYKLFKVDFEHNELGKDILTSANSQVKGFSLPKYNAIDTLSIDDSLINANATLKIKDFENINAAISAKFVKTALVYAASSSMTDKAIKDILTNITDFSVDAAVGGTLEKPEINLSTDLDKKIAKGLKTQVSKEVKKYQKELKVAINQEFKKQVKDLNLGEFQGVEELLNSDLQDSDALENFLEKNISQEALQKQLGSKALGGFADKLKLF